MFIDQSALPGWYKRCNEQQNVGYKVRDNDELWRADWRVPLERAVSFHVNQ